MSFSLKRLLFRSVSIKNKFLAEYYLRQYQNPIAQIVACQTEIAHFSPHPLYHAYRPHELRYWIHIPKWLIEDHQKYHFKNCLDIGCAYGTLALFCKKSLGCDVYCADFIDEYLSKSLIDKYKLNFCVNNIELDPSPWDIQFDIILLTEVLEHFNFYAVPTLKKIRSLLSENGKIYLSTPDAAEWGRVTKYYTNFHAMPLPTHPIQIIDDHIYQYTRPEIIDLLKESGLHIDEIRYSPGSNFRHFNLKLSPIRE